MREFLEYLIHYRGAIRKFFVALGAAIVVLLSVWADGSISGFEWLEVIAAFLGALGVYGVPNKNVETTIDQI